MDFNNPQVRQRVMQHINFAVGSVAAAMPVDENIYGDNEEAKLAYQMAMQLRNPIIMQILSFTLNLDHVLKNTLSGIAPHL